MTQFLGFITLVCLFAAFDSSTRMRTAVALGVALVFAGLMMLSFWDWRP